MFTGIIENTTTVLNIIKKDPHIILICECPFTDLTIGESISINGVCLTVTSFNLNTHPKTMEFFVSHESLKLTDLSQIKTHSRLNLERALRCDQRLSGHIVQGHVDGKGVIEKITPDTESTICEFKIPNHLRKYCVKKGSICISGISLTLNEIIETSQKDDFFSIKIQIIPHTWKNTHLHTLSPGSIVNIESDILAKYVENMTKFQFFI